MPRKPAAPAQATSPPGDGGGDAGTPPTGLTPKQEAAIAALVGSPSIAKAADLCGVNERTIYRWLREPAFARAFREARRQSFGHAISLAQHYSPMALNNLAKIAGDPSAGHAARVSASLGILKVARESIELDELVGRVEALEAAAERQKDEDQDEGRRRSA